MSNAKEVANLCKSGVKGYNEMNGRIYETSGAGPTLRANSGGHNEIKILEPHACAMRGRNPDNPSDRTRGCPTKQRIEIGGTVSNTLTTVQKDAMVIEPSFRVRKLTPKENWRLMGFDDADFYRAKYGREIPTELAARIDDRSLNKEEWKNLWRHMRREQMSNSQLYKQAGNSIVVNVLMAIFKEML
ncbi:MAG: hypothetical protein IKG01_08265 [Lachnospiraceae bacterium]|nr:hypothetical protein [Lachnospiraceae bacterium]